MTTTALNTPRDHALIYRNELEVSVFVLGSEPASERKRPVLAWEPYQKRHPSVEEIENWFRMNPNYNIAIVTGSISKIIAFDIDGPAAVKRVEEKRMKMSTNLRNALDNTMVNKTGSGGTHIIFKVEDDISDISNKVLWSDGQAHSQILLQGNNHYIVAAPSIHPNGKKYEWNGKRPELVTRQEINEFVRLLSSSSSSAVLENPPQTRGEVVEVIGSNNFEASNRTLTPGQIDKLVELAQRYYIDGERDHFIFYLSGMMRKDGGFTQDTARRFIVRLLEESPYNDEDLDKSLTVLDNTYRKPLNELNGKFGLHDLIVKSHESTCSTEEYIDRADIYSRICQIINPESAAAAATYDESPGGYSRNNNNNNNNNDDNSNFPGKWLSQQKLKFKDPKDCPATALLAQEILKLERFRTLEDTKEILWYHKGVFRYGGEQRILSRLDELGGYGVNIAIRREVIEYIKIKNFTPREEFDKDPLLRSVKNGIVDLRTGKWLPHDPERYPSLIQIPHNYYTPEEMKERLAARPKVSRFLCKRIIFQFLCNVLEPQDIRLAIDFWGYDLIGDNRFQKALMNTGPPDVGKSTQVNITEAFLGKKNCSNKTLEELTRNRFAKADLYGKLANTCADISSSKLKDTAVFKMLVSGDDISAEKKNRDPFSFAPFCKLHFSANTPPLPNEESDDAYFKRWILLVYEIKKKQFLDKSKDVVINRKLLEEIVHDENELSDLLYLAVQAARKLLREDGFSAGQGTRNIDIIREEYTRKAKPVVAWVEDNCVLGSEYHGEKPVLFADFRQYCKKEHLPAIGSIIGLARELADLYHVEDVYIGKRKERKHVWKGIALISSLRPEEQTEILGEDKYE